MSRFFPVSSVKVGNSHSNGSGFVDITNNSKAEEEMTSNDTVLVSNETETDIFANETTPQYVLMSHPLLTLNDSNSVLGGKSTLVSLESSPTVTKTVLLSGVLESTRAQTFATAGRTIVFASSQLTSLKVKSVEKLKSSKLSSSHATQISNVEDSKIESSLMLQSTASERLQDSSIAVVHSLRQEQQSSIQLSPLVVSQLRSTIATQTFNTETGDFNLAPKSPIVASTLEKIDPSPLVTLNSNSPVEMSRVTDEILLSPKTELVTLTPFSSSLPMDKPEVMLSSSTVHFVGNIKRSELIPQTTLSVRSEMSSTGEFSSNVATSDDQEARAKLSSNILPDQVTPTAHLTKERISVSLSVPTPTRVLSRKMSKSSSLSSLSLMETPISVLNTALKYAATLSLVSEKNQNSAQAPEETKPAVEGVTISSLGLSTREIATGSIDDSLPTVSSGAMSTIKIISRTPKDIVQSVSASNSVDLHESRNLTVQSSEGISFPSFHVELLRQQQNVHQLRSSSLVSPTPSLTAHITTKNPVTMKLSSIDNNARSNKFSRIQEERDEIPVITPRLQEIPSLSDVSPTERHSLTSFADTNTSALLHGNQNNTEASITGTTSETVLAMALSSLTLSQITSDSDVKETFATMVLSSPQLAPSLSQATTEAFTALTLSRPTTAQNVPQDMLTKRSIIASTNTGTGFTESDGSKKLSDVGASDFQRSHMRHATPSLTNQASSFREDGPLTVVASGTPAKPSLFSSQISSTALPPSSQGAFVTSTVKMETSMLLTPNKQEASYVKASNTEGNATPMSFSGGVEVDSKLSLRQEHAVPSSVLDTWLGEPTTNLHGDSIVIETPEENSATSSSPLLLNVPTQTQTSASNNMATTATFNKTGSVQSLTPDNVLLHIARPESSNGISASLAPSKQQVLSSASASKQNISAAYTRQNEIMPLSSKRLSNINTPSTKFGSISASFGATTKENHSSSVSATTQSKVSKRTSNVLLGKQFSSGSVKTENSRISISATLGVQDPATNGNILATTATLRSTSVAQTLDEVIGKVQDKEKVVRNLASGIIASPVFHHAINHIGELLKNETGIVGSVSRLESMLGHLQSLVVHETRNQLQSSSNMSLPLEDNVQKGNGSEEISKQVASKLDGISSKLKRISSVLTELQIKRKEPNSTLKARSDVERPGNLTRVDKKHNELIELLLKRFSKLEAMIHKNRGLIAGSSLAEIGGHMHANFHVIQRSTSEDSSRTIQLQTRASHLTSVIVPTPSAATAKWSTPAPTQTREKSTIAPLSSKPFATNDPWTTMKSTSSLSATSHKTKHIVSSPTTSPSLNLLQTGQIKPPSINHLPIQSSISIHVSVLSREIITSSNVVSTDDDRSRTLSPSLRTKTKTQNSSSQQRATLTLSLTARKVRNASSVVNATQSLSHRQINSKAHVDRSEEFTYVTFRSGMEAGVFTESGKVKDMESCVERCFNRSSCHVAFMVEHTCYSIHCYSQKTCEVLPVQTPVITTRVVYLRDRMLKLPYNTTREHSASPVVRDDKNFTIKNCAKNVTVLKNMTFLAGMSAGNYTDYGTVDSIQACSNICCSKKVCDAAFMILNNCFTIDCISDKACHAIPSKSNKVNTSIVYFRKNLSTERFQGVQMRKPNVKNSQLCPLLGGVRKGVTFNGGISAGNFTDHGYVEEFSSCIEKCCSTEACDVAFMIEKNCYSVKCAKNKRRCIPIVARSTKFKTFMAVKASVYSYGNLQASQKCARKGPTKHNFTFRRGIKAGTFTEHVKVKNMSICIEACCNSSSCSAAFMIGRKCYSVACPSEKDCETVLAKSKDFTTVIAFVDRTQKGGDKLGKTKSNLRQKFTKTILGGHCDVTDVQRNVNITGGWKAGKFLRIPDIKDMTKCTEACCDYHGCAAAMVIDQYCYNLVCFKTRGCKLIGSHGAFMIDKFVAVRKNLGHVLSPFNKAQIAVLTASKQHVNHSFFLQDVQNANKINQNYSLTRKLNASNKAGNEGRAHTLSPELVESLSINPTRTRFRTNSEHLDETMFNSNVKKHEIPFHISSEQSGLFLIPTLLKTPYSPTTRSISTVYKSVKVGAAKKSAIIVTNQFSHAQNITRGGNLWINSSFGTPSPVSSVSSIENKAKIVTQSSGNVTPLTVSRQRDEETSSASSNNMQNATKVPPEAYSFKSDYSLMREEHNHNRKRTYACTHTFVFNNATLRGGLNAGDVKNEGNVEGMEECVEMCCKTLECNVALLLNETCYIVACSNKRSCEAVPDKHTSGKTKVAYVARSKDETELIKQLISHTETSKTDSVSDNKTKDGQPTQNKDLQTAPNVIVRQGLCFRSPILRNVRFKLGRHAGDFKPVGVVKSIHQCVASCCKESACNAIFMLGSRCNLVSCSNEQDCQTVEAKSDFYNPTVVYLAKNEAEVAYLFKLIPKKILDEYKGNVTFRVNATIDGSESAIRRSQLQRADGNNSISLSISAEVTAPSKGILQAVFSVPSTTQKVTLHNNAHAEVTSSSALQSSSAFHVHQNLSESPSNVNATATSNSTVVSAKVFATIQNRKSSFSNLRVKTASVSQASTRQASVTKWPLTALSSAVFKSDITSMMWSPGTANPTEEVTSSKVKAVDKESASVIRTINVSSQENLSYNATTSTRVIITTSALMKYSVQTQFRIPGTNSIKSTNIVARADSIQVKSSVVQSERSKIQSYTAIESGISAGHQKIAHSMSENTMRAKEASKKEQSNANLKKTYEASSVHTHFSFRPTSRVIEHAVKRTTEIMPSLSASLHHVKPSPANVRANVELSPTPLTQKISTTSHQQSGSGNEHLTSHAINTAKHTAPKISQEVLSHSNGLHASSSISNAAHAIHPSDFSTLQGKTYSTKSTEKHVFQEHKRGDIARSITSMFSESPRIQPQSHSEKASSATQKHQLTALNQTKPSPSTRASESATSPKSNQTAGASAVQTVQVSRTLNNNDIAAVRSTLNGSFYTHSSITARVNGTSVSLSLVTSVSQRPAPDVASTQSVSHMVKTKSAVPPPSIKGANATSMSGATAGHIIITASSNQSPLSTVYRASYTLSSSRNSVNGVNTMMLTPSPTIGVRKVTNTPNELRATLTVSQGTFTPNLPSVSRIKETSSLLKDIASEKGPLASSAERKTHSSSSTTPQPSGVKTPLLLSTSLQHSSQLSSTPITHPAKEIKTSSVYHFLASVSAKVASTPNLVSVSVPQDISMSPHPNVGTSALNDISRTTLKTTSALTFARTKKTSSLSSAALSSNIERHGPLEIKHMTPSPSRRLSQSEPRSASLKMDNKNTLLRLQPSQTLSSLNKTQELLRSLQNYLSNMTPKRNTIPRNGNSQDSYKQKASLYSDLSKIVKELSANFPNMPLIQALNHSVVTLVSNTSRNESDLTAVKLLLSDIQKRFSHKGILFQSSLNLSTMASTLRLLTPNAPIGNDNNSSTVGANDISRRTKSSVYMSSWPITSTLNYNNYSSAHASLVIEENVATAQLSHFPSEVTGNSSSSSIVEQHKRIEIPFAGGLLEQIKMLHSPSTLKQQHSTTDSVPDSTPISGLYLEQIRRIHASSPHPSDKLSVISPQLASNLASSIAKLLATGSKTLENDRIREGKAKVDEDLQHTELASSYNQIVKPPTSNVPNSMTYSSTTTTKNRGKASDGLISHSKTFTLHSTPSPKKDQEDRPSSLRLTKPTLATKPIPSAVINTLEMELSRIMTPALESTPVTNLLRSHSTVDRSKAITKVTSGTVKITVDHSTTIHFPLGTNESSATAKTVHDGSNGYFGYFAQLLKSIKDILTKRKHKPGDKSSVALLSSVPVPSLQHVITATELFSNPRFASPTSIITEGTLQQSSFKPVASSVTPTKALDISLAMQPLHQLALNITGIHKAALCKHSLPHENSTMRGGIHSGLFKEVGTVNSDAECISQCCVSNTCDAAFLLLNRCFLVTCKSRTLCESVQAKNLVFRPRVIYIENKTVLSKRGRSKNRSETLTSDIQEDDIYSSTRAKISLLSTHGARSVKIIPMTNTPQLKSQKGKNGCEASVIRQNVTLRGGIKSGHFRDRGTVESMKKCVELCCSADNCSVAFMLLNRCFSVSCYNESLCNSIAARSLIFQPQVAYVQRNVISKFTPNNNFKTIEISKTHITTRTSSATDGVIRTNSLARFDDNCHYGNSEKSVTLRGGLNAGSFLDTGVVRNIEECVNNCCHATKCDVAFMIMKRCFLVTCYSVRLCQSVPARNIGYLTEMAHVTRDETAVVRDLLARLVKPSSPSVKIKSLSFSSLKASTYDKYLQNTSSSLFVTDTTGGPTVNRKNKHTSERIHFTGVYMGSSLSSTPPALPALGALIESVIAPLNVNKHENVGLIQTLSMSTRLKSSRHALHQTITPSFQRLHSLSSGSTWHESVGNVSVQGKKLESGASSEDEICQSTTVYYNATMRGGINAGVFKDQGPVQNMRKCIEQCCRWQFCSVAFMLFTRCYIIACYNEHLCDPVPARNVTFTPRVVFVSRVRRDHGNFSNSLENISTPPFTTSAKSHLKTSTSQTNLTTIKAYLHTEILSPSKVTSEVLKLPSSLEIKPSPSMSTSSKVFTLNSGSRHNCTKSEEQHNITLRGGLSAGHFKDRGKVQSMQECVDFCCTEEHCDVALMLLENCFAVICRNKRLCESVPAKTGRYRSRLVYVGKSRGVSSVHSSTHKLTKTVSLLDAALPAMGEYNNNGTSRSGAKTTFSDSMSSFDYRQLAELLSPSRSFKVVGQKSSMNNFANQSKESEEQHILRLQDFLNKTATVNNFNGLASHHNQHHLMPTSVSSGHNISLLSSSTVRLNASVLTLTEPNKSALEEGLKSGSKSGLELTFGDSSQHSTSQPSSCLNSPISYNVTLRNGIRSGYFRDQGRVENMGECIQKCCGAADCNVAFLLKRRCYLVTCYTKKGCETVPARHSVYRPRVSHVQRANDSQLMSFMDEQETSSVQPRSSAKSHHITPSSTLPVLVKSLDYSIKHEDKPKTSSQMKAKTSTHHKKTKHRKLKSRSRGRAGSSGKRRNTPHVTVTPEVKKRKARKSKKSRHTKQGNELKERQRESPKAKLQHFKNKLEKRKDRKLSHSDLDQLFRLMRPTKRVSSSPSKSDAGSSNVTSYNLKDTIQPEKIITGEEGRESRYKNATLKMTAPSTVTSPEEHLHKATVTGQEFKTSDKTKAAPNLHRHSSSSSVKGTINQHSQSTSTAINANSTVIKSGNKAKVENSFASQVKALLEKKDNDKELTSSHSVEPTRRMKSRQKATAKEKVTHSTTRHFLDHVTRPTVRTQRHRGATGTTSRLSIARNPTVMPTKGSSHHKSQFRATKSTVPSLPTQAPGVEVSSCVTGDVEYNQTLRGGLSSGLFHEVGKVNDIQGCSEHCCSSPICDLAFMVLSRCFLVTCSSSNRHMCDSTPALATNFNPMISRVSRGESEDKIDQSIATASTGKIKPVPTVKPITSPPKLPAKEEPATFSNVSNQPTPKEPVYLPTTSIYTPQRPTLPSKVDQSSAVSIETPPTPPGCIASLTEHNVTLRGGLHAGKFTDAGRVNGSYICTELCCKSDKCDVAFFAFHRCFLVKCFDEYLCTSTPSLLPNFNPTVVHVYHHHSKPTPKPATTLPPISDVLEEIEDETQTKSNQKNKSCAHSEVYEEVTLRNGYKAGNFTSHGKVNSTNQCVDFCCSQADCDLIFMFFNNCFTVSCISGYDCEIVPARQSRFKPKVVYFIKNNSTRVIKPSEFNSSLTDPESFVGKQPVNAVHYKELRSNRTKSNSYKKDLSQMNNNTETVDEVFMAVPDNKITSRNKINLAGNTTSQRLRHNVSKHLGVISHPLSTKQHLKNEHKLGVKGRNKSQADEKIDLVLNKLTNVTEENKRLEGEIHVLMDKQHERGHKTKIASTASSKGKQGGKNPKKPTRKVKGEKVMHETRTEVESVGLSDTGSGVDSKAQKRVVLVDTDRSPVHPPTDEHRIEEHSIHSFQRKTSQNKHHLSPNGKKTAKVRPSEKQKNGSKAISEHWDPTNEHDIEEHVIYNPTKKVRHSSKANKKMHAEVQEGSEIKYGQPQDDEDDRELSEIVQLKQSTKAAEEPDEPVWINSSDKNEDSLENFHNQISTHRPHFNFKNQVTKESANEDEFDFEHHDDSKTSESHDWVGARSKNKDNLENFQQQIAPTHRSDFKLEGHKESTSEDKFNIYNQEKPMESEKHVWINQSDRNKGHLENFSEQLAPTHRSHFQIQSQRKNDSAERDEFHNENENEQKSSERPAWTNSDNREKDHMSFHDQVTPTHKSHFHFEKQGKNDNGEDDEFRVDNQDEQKAPEKHVWVGSSNGDSDVKETFHEQMAPSDRTDFQFDNQKERDNDNEDKFHVEDINDDAKDSERHVWRGSTKSRNEDRMGSFHDQIAPTHKVPFEFENQKTSENTNEDKIHVDGQDEPSNPETRVWSTSRHRNKDHMGSFHEQIAPTHRTRFEFKKLKENERANEDKIHISTQNGLKDLERPMWRENINENKDQMGNFQEQIAPTHRSGFQWNDHRKSEDKNKDTIHLEHQVEPSFHELAGAEPDAPYDKEDRKMSVQGSLRKEDDLGFTMSKSFEPHLSEYAEVNKNLEKSHPEHSIETPVFVKNDFAEARKRVSNDDKDRAKVDNIKSSEGLAVTEKPLNISTTSLVAEHSAKANFSHEKPDFDAIYNKINNIYNRLQDLLEAHSKIRSNTTLASVSVQQGGRQDLGNEHSRRLEEVIPTPPVSALRPTTRASSRTTTTKKARVVKQYVTDDLWGSGTLPPHHGDALMDYIKTIYSRVQWLYKKKHMRAQPRTKARKTGHRRKKFRHSYTSGDGTQDKNTARKKTHSRKKKTHHPKNIQEESLLREMKQIYKNMKKMYHEQRKAQRKAKKNEEKSAKQRERSFIPSQPGSSTTPNGLVTNLENPVPLTSRIKDVQRQPQVHETGRYPPCIV